MLKVIRYRIGYLAIRLLIAPLSLLSYSALHKLASWLTPVLFPLLSRYRKRALSNLALAKALSLSNAQIVELAKKSLTNLLITALEYGKIGKETNLQHLVTCQNPEVAAAFIQKGQGVVFFCAHQANWELLFLEGTQRMPGTAIGRAVKNPYLYQWVLSIRERFGGKIIPPKNALKESLKALKKGIFVGIVGDQGMPDSGFSSLFLGRKAWTSPLPALLAYRTKSPLFFALTVRKKGRYEIFYSDPILPDETVPADVEVPKMMGECLALLEKSIIQYPDQWLWQHNKWKLKLPGSLRKVFRHDSLALVLPQEKEDAKHLLSQLKILRDIYPEEWMLLLAPFGTQVPKELVFDLCYFYTHPKELFITHYGPKLIFDFSQVKGLKNHFLKLAAFNVYTLRDLEKLSGVSYDNTNLSTVLTKACRYAQ